MVLLRTLSPQHLNLSSWGRCFTRCFTTTTTSATTRSTDAALSHVQTTEAHAMVDRSHLSSAHEFPFADFVVFPSIIDEAEAAVLHKDVQKALKRRRYEKDHWDSVIYDYREIEHSQWSGDAAVIINRVKDTIATWMGHEVVYLPQNHILDLNTDGFIKPHVDSIKFSGRIVAGISLFSDAIMRFRPHDVENDCTLDPDAYVDALLQENSLYVMTGHVRYQYTHEILNAEDTLATAWGCDPIKRGRRISVMFRDKLNSH